MPSPQQLHLKWNDFQKNITLTFEELRQHSDFADVTLVSEDKQRIEAHKLILACGSDFFTAVLADNKNSHPLIYMRGTKAKVLASVVAFIYQGEVDLPENELDDFIQLATELKVKGVELPEESKKQFEEPSTSSSTREKLTTNEKFETAGCKIESTPKTTKPKKDISNFDEKTRDVDSSDENTTVVKFKEENPVLEETIQSLLVRSGQGWSCSICGKSNRRLAKISRHAETHVELRASLTFAPIVKTCAKLEMVLSITSSRSMKREVLLSSNCVL